MKDECVPFAFFISLIGIDDQEAAERTAPGKVSRGTLPEPTGTILRNWEGQDLGIIADVPSSIDANIDYAVVACARETERPDLHCLVP